MPKPANTVHTSKPQLQWLWLVPGSLASVTTASFAWVALVGPDEQDRLPFFPLTFVPWTTFAVLALWVVTLLTYEFARPVRMRPTTLKAVTFTTALATLLGLSATFPKWLEWLRVNAEWLAALAGVFAVIVAAVSIGLAVRTEQRANTREARTRDDSLQARLDPQYPELRRVLGASNDGVPGDIRGTLITFFVLYSDAFTASRDGLLSGGDGEAFLDEFASWSRRRNARLAWCAFRQQTWPSGFVDYVDRRQREPGAPYNELVLRHTQGVDWAFDLQHNPTLSDWQYDLIAESLVVLWQRERDSRAGRSRRDYRTYFPDLVPGGSARTPWKVQPPRRKDAAIWLEQAHEESLSSWVALVGSVPIAYIQVSAPGAYLELGSDAENHLEIKRLFVNPSVQSLGLARALLNEAVKYIKQQRKQPVLGVLKCWEASRRFYEYSGWIESKEVEGRQGTNVIMLKGSVNFG